jgi:glycosyltransferase involved in cell wall biosynthesis
MTKLSLRDIHISKKGYVSDKWDLYLDEYEYAFHDFREANISLLEIGVQNGGSLEVWANYFSHAKNIIGIDVNPDCANLSYTDPRISVIIGDVKSEIIRENVSLEGRRFDIIIDDGSHSSKDIVVAFTKYFSLLRDGGVYAVEDLHCSYWREYEGGLFYEFSSISFFKLLADVVNGEHWLGYSHQELFKQFFDRYSCDFSDEDFAAIHSVKFVNSMCFIRKDTVKRNMLGYQQVSGELELVVKGRLEYNKTSSRPGTLSLQSLRQDELDALTEQNLQLRATLSNKEMQLLESETLLARLNADLFETRRLLQVSSSPIPLFLRKIVLLSTKILNKLHVGISKIVFILRDRKRRNILRIFHFYKSRGLKNFLSTTREIFQRVQLNNNKVVSAPGYSDAFSRLIFRQRNKNHPKYLDKKIVISYGQSPQFFEAISNGLPQITLLTPVYKTDLNLFVQLYESVQKQTITNWRWVIVDDCSEDYKLREFLTKISDSDNRIHIILRKENGGISAASNDALNAAETEFVALLDHDDLLTEDALFEMARVINAWPEVDLIYSDEDKINQELKTFDAYLKPGWSPYHLLSRMYVSHFAVYRRSVIANLGGFRSLFDGAQDYDLALRVFEVTEKICHIPKILYHWRVTESSTAGNLGAKNYAIDAQKRALQEALSRRGLSGQIVSTKYLGNWRPIFDLPSSLPLISIVIPTAGKDATIRGSRLNLLSNCIDSILKRSSYQKIEIVVVHNGDLSDEVKGFCDVNSEIKLIKYEYTEFNLSEKINKGVTAAHGEYVVVLNDDVEVISADWLESMFRVCQQQDVGAVGAKLFFENLTIQHAGVLFLDQGPSHAGIGASAANPGRDLVYDLLRDVIAVTGACLMCRKSRFLEVGGFDTSLPLNYNDIDFCLKLKERGWHNVYEPSAQLFHFESISKTGTFQSELVAFQSKWGNIDDPYYNLNFDRTTPFYLPLAQDKSEQTYESWLSQQVINRYNYEDVDFGYPADGNATPFFSIVTSAYNTSALYLDELAASIKALISSDYEWVILDNGSTISETSETLHAIKASNDHVRLFRVETNLGIAGGMKFVFDNSNGRYVLPVDSDDVITPDALSILRKKIISTDYQPLYYSDEDKLFEGSRVAPFLKPDWDPVMFLNCCYVAHLCAIEKVTADRLAVYSDPNSDGCHDYDTFYRFIRDGIVPIHVPEILYSWRIHSESTASGKATVKPFTKNSQRHVLNSYIERVGQQDRFSVIENTLQGVSGMWRLYRKHINPAKILLVVSGTRSSQDFSTSYPLVDVVYSHEEIISCHIIDRMKNYDFIGFIDSTVDLRTPDWLWEAAGLMEFFSDSSAVGGALYDPFNRCLWGGGYFNFQEGRRSPFEGNYDWSSGYYGLGSTQRTCDTLSPFLGVLNAKILGEVIQQFSTRTVAGLFKGLMEISQLKGLRIIHSPFIRGVLNEQCDFSPEVPEPNCRKSAYYPRQMSPRRPFSLS